MIGNATVLDPVEARRLEALDLVAHETRHLSDIQVVESEAVAVVDDLDLGGATTLRRLDVRELGERGEARLHLVRLAAQLEQVLTVDLDLDRGPLAEEDRTHDARLDVRETLET